MMGTLTVRENFHFSASLRLPSHMTRQQRKERVEKVIDELGLTKCADTKVTSLSPPFLSRFFTLLNYPMGMLPYITIVFVAYLSKNCLI